MRRLLAICCCLAACEASTPAPRSEGPPQRIVSLTVLGDEVLWHLGPDVRRRVVALSKLCDHEAYSGVAGKWPRSIPRARGTAEHLVSLQPDLVILASFSSEEIKAFLRRAAVPSLVISHLTSFDDYRKNVRRVAEAVGDEAGGEALVARFDERLGAIAPRETSLSVVSWMEGMVAGAATTFNDAARAAGLVNLAATHGLRGFRRVTLERLVAWDPDRIVIGCGGSCDAAEARFVASVGAGETRAARTGGIITIPDRVLLSTGEDMLTLVERLAGRAR